MICDPTRTVSFAGVTVTRATGTVVTVSVEVSATDPEPPAVDAMMSVVPVECAVTAPLPFTEATLGLVDDHEIGRPENESWFPCES